MRGLAFGVMLLTGCWATADPRPSVVLSKVQPGMTQAQVIEVGGEPDTMVVGPERKVTWTYGTTRVLWGADGRVASLTSP